MDEREAISIEQKKRRKTRLKRSCGTRLRLRGRGARSRRIMALPYVTGSPAIGGLARATNSVKLVEQDALGAITW